MLALPRVAKAELSLVQTESYGELIAVLRVTVAPEAAEGPAERKGAVGLLAGAGLGELPTLYKSDRALLKVILNGGVGVYNATNPFFGKSDVFLKGSPIAHDPAGDDATWTEQYVEPGLGGITQVGSLPLYAYGAATYVVAQSLGQDIYNSYTRQRGTLEKAYAGALFNLPGKGNAFDVSAGRQIYQLRDGFLISKVPGSTNIGRLGGLLLGPRLAFEKTLMARAKVGNLRAEGIFLEPTEYEEIPNSDTHLAGGTLDYALGPGVEVGFTYLQILHSDGVYVVGMGANGPVRLSPEGVRTYNASLRANSLFGLDGLWFKGEYAFQDNKNYAMSAQAGYAWLGYDADGLPWKPGLSYRYSIFTGDDPDTKTYERFDPLFSGGQQNFVCGMVMNSDTKNANLITHRDRGSVKPVDTLEVVLDYFRFRADRYNNYGAMSSSLWKLESKNLADEVDLSAFWFVGKNVYLQGLAAVAVPGDGLKEALGGGLKNWYNFQLALYFFY